MNSSLACRLEVVGLPRKKVKRPDSPLLRCAILSMPTDCRTAVVKAGVTHVSFTP